MADMETHPKPYKSIRLRSQLRKTFIPNKIGTELENQAPLG